ncbi:MAG: hypothetical protein FJ297_13420 [Planctomycetes bacterium]|nr:hypothetical protein [Planctomycetota bacterium]
MARYQVESGSVRMVVQADDARKAALWAVHRVLRQVLPLGDDSEETDGDAEEQAVRRGCAVMGDVLRLRTLDGGTTARYRFATFDVVTEWTRLMIALARLERDMATAV